MGGGTTQAHSASPSGENPFLNTRNVTIGILMCGAVLGQVLSAKYGKRFMGAEFVKASKDVTKRVYKETSKKM